MGAPTKTQAETWFDHIAAIVQKDIDGFIGEHTPLTATTLWDMVDASGDPTVEAGLASVALDVDEQSLLEYVRDWLPTITGRAELAAWVVAFNTLVKSTPGGGYASLRAYLVDKSAKLHPLAGEVIRRSLGETAFTSSSTVLGISNPSYSAIFPTRVYVGADGSLSDETTDATDVGTADITLFGSDDHTLYIGSNRQFSGIVVALSTLASATITPTFQYWNGAAWATLTCTDNTTGFTKNELISFTAPTDWSRYYKDSGGTAFADLARLYYIRIARTANSLVTPPAGTMISVIPVAITTTATGTAHAAVTQPPLAIVRITAASTVTVTAPATIDYSRFAEPVGTESKLQARALTPIGSNLTITLAYTDATGAATGSTAQSAWTAPAADGTQTLALTSSDAIRAVRTATTVSTSATEGVFVIEALPIRTPAL